MKYFVVSDIHGYFYELQKALEAAGFDRNNPNHTFVSCGDLIDRGTYPYECLKFVLGLAPDRRILISGNHEDLMDKMLQRGWPTYADYHNGTYQSVRDILRLEPKQELFYLIKVMQHNEMWMEYRHLLVPYFETKTAIFVHGWLPCKLTDMRHPILTSDGTTYDIGYSYKVIDNWRSLAPADWETAKWINGMEAWVDGARESDKTVYCGHWHTSWAWCHLSHKSTENDINSLFDAWKQPGICALDACTPFTHKVNVEVLEDEPISN